MKTKMIFSMLLFMLLAVCGLHADVVLTGLSSTVDAALDTTTAQALSDLLKLAGNTPASWLHFAQAVVLGALISIPAKNILNHVMGASPNPVVRFGTPFFSGMILSTVSAFALKTWGVTPQDAATAFASFWSFFELLQSGGLAQLWAKVESLIKTDAPAALRLAEVAAVAAGQPGIAAGLGVTEKALQTVQAIHADAVTAQASAPKAS